VQTEEAASEEAIRIEQELRGLAARAGFPLELLPIAKVKSAEEAKQAKHPEADVIIVYPATGSGGTLRACFSDTGNTLIFLRKASGPVYYWFEALSVKYLDTGDSPPAEGALTQPVSVHDVVVDAPDELLWRFRALYAVKNFRGAKIVALGGPAGKYAPEAPQRAIERYGFQIVSVPYEEFQPRVQRALADTSLMAAANRWTDVYLADKNVRLATGRDFVVNSFALYRVFKDLMEENDTHLFTIQECMSAIMPMAKTTACLTLSLLNDEGQIVFCESDFVIIPCGVLLHYVSGKPVFLHNSTFPHKGVVTCAHCTGPRRMNGEAYEPALITTHYESEFGASPKIDMPIGQEVTFIDPEYDTGRWLGFKGRVEENPSYEICRSQQNVRIEGGWKKLLKEIRDSHWVMAYGDHLDEAEYAARKLGLRWEGLG